MSPLKHYALALLIAALSCTPARGANDAWHPILGGNESIVQTWCATGAAVVTPNTLVETVVFTCALPAGAIGANGTMRVYALLRMSTTTDDKIIRVRYGGLGGGLLGSYTFINVQQTANAYFTIINQGSLSAQRVIVTQVSNASVIVADMNTSLTAVDTSGADDVVITCAKEVAAQLCDLWGAYLEIEYKP